MRRAAWILLASPVFAACLVLEQSEEKKDPGGGAGGVIEGGVFPEAEAGAGGGDAGGEAGSGTGGAAGDASTVPQCLKNVDCSACVDCIETCVCGGEAFALCKSQCGGGGTGGLPP